MIYYIGGAPRIGKTQLAKRLNKKTGFSWITTDNIRESLKYLDAVSVNNPAKKNWINWQDEDYPENLFEFHVKKIIEHQMEESAEVAKMIKGVTESLSYLDRDFIFEGVALMPTFFDNEFVAKNNIKFSCVGNSDFNSLFEYSWKYRTEGDWLARVDKQIFRRVIKFSVALSREFRKQAKNRGLSYFEISSPTFFNDIKLITDKLLG